MAWLNTFSGRIGLLLVLSLFLVFFELGRRDVTEENEGQRVAPPKHMLRTGDWVVPELNGQPYLAKPPLLYWANAGVYWVTGNPSEFNGRIVSGACGVAVVLLVYLVLRKKASDDVAFYTALAILCSNYLLQRFRYAELEPPLLLACFGALAALHSAWIADGLRKWGMAILAGVCLGAATMLKGPVPYLFVLGAYVAFVLTHDTAIDDRARDGMRAAGWCLLLGMLLYLLPIPFPVALTVLILWWLYLLGRAGWGINIAALPQTLLAVGIGIALTAPWAWMVLERLGWERIQLLLNSEVIDRTHTATIINSGFPLYYIVALPFMLAPFGLLLPVQFSNKQWLDNPPFYRFALAMAWFSIALFSLIAGKEYEYVMPAIPFLLAALAYPVAQYTQGTLDPGKALWFDRWVKGFRYLLPFLAFVAFMATLLDGVSWVQVAETAAIGIVVVAASLPALPSRSAAVVRTAILGGLVVLSIFLIKEFRQTGDKSPREMALICKQLVEQGVPIEATKIYAAFNFYSELPIPIERDPAKVEARITGDAPYFYVTTTKLLKENFPHPETYESLYVFGPLDTHDLVLLGNRPLSDVVGAGPAN